jgi:hypothetical protein
MQGRGDRARQAGVGWQFRIDVIPAGLRISAGVPDGGDPAVWIVTE